MDAELLTPEAVADPHPLFAQLRADDPVHWSPRHRAWILSRYDDVAAGFRDPRLSADRISAARSHQPPEVQEAAGPAWEHLGKWMVFTDPPDHDRLRRLVSRAFTPRAVERLRPRIEAVTDELLDEVTGQTDGTFDVLRRVAYPLPARVIAELLGVPAEDRSRFASWSGKLAGLVFGAVDAPARHGRALSGVAHFESYFGDLVEQRRAEPDGSLLSDLVAVTDEGDRLTHAELVSTCTLLIFAGHETTATLIGNGLFSLLRHPDQLALVRADDRAAAAAPDELLRFEGPAKVMVRVAREDLTVHGRTIRAGDRVFLAVGSANRDEERFSDPDRLDVLRPENLHLGFGWGIHYCLGAPLARLEAQVALTRLVRRFPDLRIDGEAAWGGNLIGRSVRGLRVTTG